MKVAYLSIDKITKDRNVISYSYLNITKSLETLKFQVILYGIPGENRTHNYALGERCYIHLTTEAYEY